MEATRSGVDSRKKSPQLVQSWEQKENRFYLYCPETVLEVTVCSENILRFRYSPEGRFADDFSYAIGESLPVPECKYELIETADQYHIITDELKCKISKTLHVAIHNSKGTLISEDERGYHWERNAEWGGNRIFCSKRIQNQESFYGMGDKPFELNLKGRRMENWGSDTYGFERQTDPLYKNIPFYYGLHHGIAYGIFFDNSFRTRFDFGHERGDVATFWAPGGEMDYYFMYGPELIRVAESYTSVTGRPELPPLWALGYQQSKWSYYPEAKLKEVASEFRKREIPCDVIQLDIEYMNGFRCFTWDEERFPDPKRVISELEVDGFKTVAIIDPGIKIDPDYFVYQQAIDKGYFCRRADGPLMEGKVWPGLCHFPDFTNPEVRKWWAKLVTDFMESGIRGIWTDMNEPVIFEIEGGTFPSDTRHDYDGHPCSHQKAHNVYASQMARATYHGTKESVYPQRPFVISRSGFAGIQRYAAVWTGDNIATWEHLWMANLQCQRLSISGLSFCGSDIGGFIGNPSGELYARWLQLGVFHPFFRTHSSGDHGDQEPWTFGEEYEAIAKKTIELRYKLLPYLYTAFWQHVSRGTPVLRSLVFLDQENPDTHFRMDEFGVGENLLVCPVTQEGARTRKLYLPKGDWYHYWSDRLTGGRIEIEVEAPIGEMPIFVRAGAVIPQFPIMQYVGEKVMERMHLHVYFLEGSRSSEMYEDDGDYYDYEQGNYRRRTFTATGESSRLHMIQRTEGRFNSDYDLYEITFHGLPFLPAGMIIDGKISMFERLSTHLGKPFTIEVDKNFETLSLMRLDGFA